jgi:hypothetical protein
MHKNSLQWNEVVGLSKASSAGSPVAPTLKSDLANNVKLAEVLKSIGQDCTQQIESYLERCETNQEGE